jgi:hypothetical protein
MNYLMFIHAFFSFSFDELSFNKIKFILTFLEKLIVHACLEADILFYVLFLNQNNNPTSIYFSSHSTLAKPPPET